jgi:hypothetical protein
MRAPSAASQNQRITAVSKSAKSRAEEQFAALQKKDDKIKQEKEETQQSEADHTARLRALRLAKEAADKEEAANATAKG